MCQFDKPDKTFASDLYLIYKRWPSARVCISDKDQLLMFYLLLKKVYIARRFLSFLLTIFPTGSAGFYCKDQVSVLSLLGA